MARDNEEFEKGDKWERVERLFDRPEPLLTRIGAIVVAESQFAFRQQAWGDTRWRARSVPNVFGIISDLTEGKTPPKRRLDPRPALQDTGRLASSINFRVTGTGVEVGTNLAYAQVHQTGGSVESEPITATVQERLAKWLRKQPSFVVEKMGPLLSPGMTGQTLKMRVPKRPFIGITEEIRGDISAAIQEMVADG